ncbi:MAG: FkbM family methyltransferase [Acidobacteria bacterium]|nr:FkbM family methyltransferase [Acidobacteriota bacterium]
MIRRMLRLIPAPIRRLILSRLRDMGWVVIRIPIEGELEVEATSGLRDFEPIDTAGVAPGASGVKDPALRPYRISMHHVGGRGGGFPFPIGRRFFPDVEMYIYDADPACRHQMEVVSPYVDHVIVAAVTGADGKDVFHVNYDPFTSSLLPANDASRGVFYQDEDGDYILEDVLTPLKTIPVAGESLDSLAKKHGSQFDYLSLDVQGAEYELLAGMSDTTIADTVAVMCEVSFIQFYANQHLFDEVMGLLRTKGFFMARLFPHGYDWAIHRTGIGWRSEGFTHGSSDALFFREATRISECAHDPFAALLKAAFIALCVGSISHALQCLTEAYKSPAPDVGMSRPLLKLGGGSVEMLRDVHR